MLNLILLLIIWTIVYYTLRYLWELIPVKGLNKKAVFISGCDTGFGRLLAIKCSKNGIPVFAGCYTKFGQESLENETKNNPGRLISLPLDVTNDESVKKASEIVKKMLPKDEKLWAVVNNAGVFNCYGPDAWNSIQDYKDSFDINTLGHIRCVHAFLPMLKQSKGRIITVTSVAGRLSVPCGAPYAAGKYAAEAYMDAIRQELKPYGITCCILEPEAFKTNLLNEKAMEKRVDHVWSKLDEETKQAYGEEFKDKFVKRWNKVFNELASPHLHYVVDNYYHAITSQFPRYRYRCGWLAILFYVPLSYLPAGFQDFILAVAAGNKNMDKPNDLKMKKYD